MRRYLLASVTLLLLYLIHMFKTPTDKAADILSREDMDDIFLRDSISIASNDSFVSAAEVRESELCFYKQ